MSGHFAVSGHYACPPRGARFFFDAKQSTIKGLGQRMRSKGKMLESGKNGVVTVSRFSLFFRLRRVRFGQVSPGVCAWCAYLVDLVRL